MTSSYRIYRIETMQTGDINHIADNIFFAECATGCPYCFNPEVCTSMGTLMTIDEILGSLSGSEWVCLMGGEPLYLNAMTIHELINALHDVGKKVVLFTGSREPWITIPCDVEHYHIDIKLWQYIGLSSIYNPAITRPYSISNTSYGLVSWKYHNKEFKKLRNILLCPIYVKSNLLQTEYDGKREYDILNSMGAKYLYMNEKIKVD